MQLGKILLFCVLFVFTNLISRDAPETIGTELEHSKAVAPVQSDTDDSGLPGLPVALTIVVSIIVVLSGLVWLAVAVFHLIQGRLR